MSFRVPEKFRIRTGPLASTAAIGNAGAFDIRLPHGQRLFCIASDGAGWEHVSVSRSDRCPTWEGKAGLADADLHFHDTRHEGITRLASVLGVLELARAVGHRDLRMLQTYYNATAEDIAKKLK